MRATGLTHESEADVSGVAEDSRLVKEGDIFCCISGEKFDGHDFAGQAADKGAICLIVERDITDADLLQKGIPQIRVPNVRVACAKLAAEFYGNPSRELTTIGITGTNGKTTTAGILSHLLSPKSEIIGTLTSEMTTPPAVDLQKKLAEFLASGAKSAVIEVSSHALHQYRIDGTYFALGVFLNLGSDHLDYHSNTEAYFEAKARLIGEELSQMALVNIDSKWGRELAQRRSDAVRFSAGDAKVIKSDAGGSTFIWEGREYEINLPGTINVENAVAALEAVRLLEGDLGEAAGKLKTLKPVKGRFEVVASEPVFVVVDFAHTPDALAAALKSGRELAGGNSLKAVFGCGGERDRQKRPAMGAVSEEYADEIYLTSDNSRNEETTAIIEEILEGINDPSNVKIEPDRKEAISLALNSAREGDLILIAGKGHEAFQTTKSGTQDFDDVKVAKELLEEAK